MEPDAAVQAADAGGLIILVRKETSPDDVHGMAASVGILTATGGLASHAAVVARGWGIPAVVGTTALTVQATTIAIGHHVLDIGDSITIDGSTGQVFLGRIASDSTVAPEAEQLRAWANELEIEIAAVPSENEDLSGATSAADESDAGGTATGDAVLRLLSIKGFATPDAVAAALRSTEEEASKLLDLMVADGLAKLTGPLFSLTDDGTSVAGEFRLADRAEWGQRMHWWPLTPS
jgi:pyruvate,orthophosphate dikinase